MERIEELRRMDLKPISPEGARTALTKAEHYRLLNEPWEAESICRDILAVDPDNERALMLLISALTDQFGDEQSADVDEVRELISGLSSEYLKLYYSGILCERYGKALLDPQRHSWGPTVYCWLQEAMDYYEQAGEQRPPGNDEALLRWNTCARLIERYNLRAAPGPPSGEYRVK